MSVKSLHPPLLMDVKLHARKQAQKECIRVLYRSLELERILIES